jgi:endo-1,4-beta-mannosidase
MKDGGFITGVNYWPAKKAMYWWKDFSRKEVAEDFSRIAEVGLRNIRIFLLWEDFQPEPNKFPPSVLDHLVTVLDEAEKTSLHVMVTFFTGHMSGINWLPSWMLSSGQEKGRFPVVSAGKLHHYRIRNCYTDLEVIHAQVAQLKEVSRVVKGHPALSGWDLGNEPSVYTIPPSREAAHIWLQSMSDTLREQDSTLPITIGLHLEDLEEDRYLGPAEAASYCDFLSMHGYPLYADWARGHLDVSVLPFLAQITGWLGQKPVLFQEFGLPVRTDIQPGETIEGFSFATEEEAERFYQQALELLHQCGSIGALAWCYSDYDRTLWDFPPFNEKIHERFFGLFYPDGRPKAHARVFAIAQEWVAQEMNQEPEWIDLARTEFYSSPKQNLIRLYHRFLGDPGQ